jgi:hypothetical protein
MRRIRSLAGVLLFALASVMPPIGSPVVSSARAAAGLPPPCAPTAASAVVSPTATWTLAPTGPMLRWQAVAFAPTVCRLIAFGGNDLLHPMSGDTWLFDPASGAWTRLAGSTRTGPSARDFGELAWDATGKRAILFGGRTAGGGRPGSNILQDTWSFDPVKRAWTPLITDCRKSLCPPARYGGALVWSSAVSKLVLFGGTTDATFAMLDDVWTFDTAWHKITTRPDPVTGTRPAGRFLFGMAEDAATGMLLVYGGAKPGIVTMHETWQLDPRTWTWRAIRTATSPTSDAEVGMAWLPSLGAIVVTGGSANNGIGIANSTWVFDRSVPTWVQVGTNQPVPSMHLDATLTTDPCHGTAIYLGPPDQVIPPTHSDYTWILR